MPAIHLFGGEKGGVGKSMVCRAAISYHLDQKLNFTVFDTDRSNPDVKRIYTQDAHCRVAVFSEGEKYEDTANTIFNAALNQRVLVNLPAQVFIPVRTWIEQNELLTLAHESDVRFYNWFVSDCGYDSLNLLVRSLEYFKTEVTHILVKNMGMTDDWEPLATDDRLQDLIAKYGVKVVDFPKFIGNVDRNTIDSLSLAFAQAREHQEFGPISRQRVKSFLRKAYAAFETTGVF
ncbi:MAG: hypothetical protein F6K19_38490 [Cyanothece sp. SIO1E1]|nr:hypothetical protein [Cyanothece sp. SIO1E1]